jgi:3-oxoadipate enol-lactonase
MRFERIRIGELGIRYGVDDRTAEAPWLLLIHCLGGSVELWQPQSPLATSFRLLAFDLRGQGESDVPESPYSIADLADDALQLLDQLSIERASVVGLLMGGLVAQSMAARYADRVDKLVLAHSTAFFPSAAVVSLEDRASRAKQGEMQQIAVEALERTMTDEFRHVHPDEAEWVRTIFERTNAAGFALACRAMADFDGRAALGEIRAPALVIAGDFDPINTPKMARMLTAGISNSRLALLPAAHLGNIEQPNAFNKLVRTFVVSETTP